MTFAFVLQSSILKHINEPLFFKFLMVNFDLIVDGHDATLYQRTTEIPEPRIVEYLDNLGKVSQHGLLGIYPPVSYQHTFRRKVGRDALMENEMLPFFMINIPMSVHVDDETHLDFDLATWDQFATVLYRQMRGKI